MIEEEHYEACLASYAEAKNGIFCPRGPVFYKGLLTSDPLYREYPLEFGGHKTFWQINDALANRKIAQAAVSPKSRLDEIWTINFRSVRIEFAHRGSGRIDRDLAVCFATEEDASRFKRALGDGK